VHFVTLLDSPATILGSFHHLGSQTLAHGFFGALARGFTQPAMAMQHGVPDALQTGT